MQAVRQVELARGDAGSAARPWLRAVIALALAAVMTGAFLVVHHEQAQSRAQIVQRFVLRAQLASTFVDTYVHQLTVREEQVARATLDGTNGLTARFDTDVAAFGFPAAVLLDNHGRALAVVPADKSLLGTDLAAHYSHLRTAEEGHVGISDVVASAAQKEAVVAFAVPFASTDGARVFSGAYKITDTPLQEFLRDTVTAQGARLFLVDATGAVVAANPPAGARLTRLSAVAPVLAAAARVHERGSVAWLGQSYYFARQRVAGTPWSLIVAVPSAVLFASVSGASVVIPWLALGLAGLFAIAVAVLTVRLDESRRGLRALNITLDQLARTDALTGLHNRRHALEHLKMALLTARRHNFTTSVLLIDIDRFKSVNDSFGHPVGDQVLRHVATVLGTVARAEDMVSRFGGEEFLVVLGQTGEAGALAAAERARRSVSQAPVDVGGQLVKVTVSVGTSTSTSVPGWSAESLIAGADMALYAAKQAGRDTVRQAPSVEAEPVMPVPGRILVAAEPLRGEAES